MAENVQITPGSGVSIGADSVLDGTLGSAQIQYVKIMDGTIGGTNKASVTANGLAVDGSGVIQPISAASLPLPSGAATETTLSNVETNTNNLDVLLSTRASETTLSGIKAQTDELTFVANRLLVDGSGVTQPISALSLPLPTGAATETTLALINGKIVTVDTSDVTISFPLPAGSNVIGHVITDSGSTTAATQSGNWSVRLEDGTGTPLTSTLLSGKQALDVNIAGGVTIDVALDHTTDNVLVYGNDGTTDRKIRTDATGNTQVVVTNFPATVDVTQNTSPWVVSGSGNFTVVQPTGTNLHAVVDSGSITIANATLAVTQSGVWTTGRTWTLASGTDSVTIGAALPAGTNVIGHVIADSGSTTVVTGNVTVVQPTAANLNATIAPLTNSSIVKAQLQDNAGTAITLGQKVMASSVPVVIASDQSAIPISGTITATPANVSSATVTSNSVGAGAAVTLLASRAARITGVIFNEAGTLFVKAGSTASSTDYTWRLTANTELDIINYTGIITAIKSAGTTNVQVTDF